MFNAREYVIQLFNDYTTHTCEGRYKAIKGEGLKILTPKQMLQRLPTALAQVKAGYTSDHQIIDSLHQAKVCNK